MEQANASKEDSLQQKAKPQIRATKYSVLILVAKYVNPSSNESKNLT